MIYLCRNKRNGLVKIGFTSNPIHREKTLQSEEPDIFFERVYAGDIHQEQELHSRFSSKRYRGEWFELDDEDIQLIDSIFGDECSSVRREIIEEFSMAISRMGHEDLMRLLDQIRCTSGHPVSVDYMQK